MWRVRLMRSVVHVVSQDAVEMDSQDEEGATTGACETR